MSEANLGKRSAYSSRSLPTFAGVALADILANGVALLIILVVISLSIRQEQDQLQLEQSREVSALLSRDLAASVVMNALPTSRPARLHDYENDPIDRNPDHNRMPILQMDGQGVRDYYTHRRYRTAELLNPDNDFDRYLRTLNPLQKARMRMDIYGIKPFYLVMSILKDHQIRIRHWHFLASKLQENAPDLSDQKRRIQSEDLAEHAQELESAFGSLGEELSAQELMSMQSFKGNSTLESYPSLEQLLAQNQGSQGEDEGRSSSQSESADAEGSAANQARGFSLRLATPNSIRAPESQADMQVSLEVLLAAAYKLMAELQQRLDLGDHLLLDEVNLASGAIVRYVQQTLADGVPPRFSLLASGLQRAQTESLKPLSLQSQAHEHNVNAMRMSRNQALFSATLLQSGLGLSVPEESTMSLNMSLYPAAYEGVRMRIGENALLLMPSTDDPDTDAQYRWRIALLVEPTSGNMILGMLYARAAGAEWIEIDSDVNGVSLDTLSAHARYSTDPLTRFRPIVLLCLVVFVSLGLFMSQRLRSS